MMMSKSRVPRIAVVVFISFAAIYVIAFFVQRVMSKGMVVLWQKCESKVPYPFLNNFYANCFMGNDSVHNVAADFIGLMKTLRIDAVLIEPSILLCMLTKHYQMSLLKFNLPFLPPVTNLLNFAVTESEIRDIESDYAKSIIKSSGFTLVRVDGAPDSWYARLYEQEFGLHYFLLREDVAMHIVVLLDRGNYFWHGELYNLTTDVQDLLSKSRVLFTEYASAYERFRSVPLDLNLLMQPTILSIPSDPVYFLSQISTSRFMECEKRSEYILEYTAQEEGWLESLQKDFIVALGEMKVQMASLQMPFYIFSGTLLGWYRQCGIIPYTTDIDFAAWAVDIPDGESVYSRFRDNARLKLELIMGYPDEALEFKLKCQGRHVDLFFIYENEEGDGLWISGHRPSLGYYWKYTYPKFTLCSGELLGHKVQVPCETATLIELEYGPNWTQPIENWYYESAPFNIGPKIYWPEDRKENASIPFYDY